MMTLKNKTTGNTTKIYTCEPKDLKELCFANIECLLQIALADSDAHIKELGGEEVLMNLMERYEKLAQKMYMWEQMEVKKNDEL